MTTFYHGYKRTRDHKVKEKKFANEILSIVEQTDFEFSSQDSEFYNVTRGMFYMPDIIKKFWLNGMYYTTRLTQDNDRYMTMYFERSNMEDFNKRYYCNIIDTIKITLERFGRCNKKDLVFGNFRFTFYQHHTFDQNMCFYCSRHFYYKCHKYHNHIKSKKNIIEYDTLIKDICTLTNLNTDSVKHIMSFLY